MTSCSPKCKDDTQCHGTKCCPNICNTKSCAPAGLTSRDNNNKYKQTQGKYKINTHTKNEFNYKLI